MEKFFAENVSWDESEREKLRKSQKNWKISAISGWTATIITVASIIPLLNLHEIITIPVTVDRQSGDYEIHVGNHRINPADPANETRMVADLTSYVAAREGFNRPEADANYKKVWWMSDDNQREEWDAEYKPENKNALLNVMLEHDQLITKHYAVSFLPINPLTPQSRVAQVRFDRIKILTGKLPRIQRFTVTIGYSYTDDNIPGKIDDIHYNAFGFTEHTYRRDKETEEHNLSDDASAADGQYRAVPSTNAQAGQGGKQ